MKRNYEKPQVEVVKFQYKDQVVAQSGSTCIRVTHYPAPDHICQDDRIPTNWI